MGSLAKPSFGILLLLQIITALTMGASTTNFSSDIIKLLYMKIYDITYVEADDKIQKLLNWMSVAILVGSMIASFMLNITTRWLGFKKAAFIGAVGCALFNGLQCIAWSPYYTLVMRLISGFFQTTFTSTTIVIVGNLVEDKRRGFIGACFQFTSCLGMIWTNLVLLFIRSQQINHERNLYYLSFIAALIFPLIAIFIFFRIPEIEEKKEQDSEQTESLKFSEMFTKKYIKLFFVSCLLGLLQQLTGINAVIIYATENFKDTFGSSQLSSVYGSLIIAGVNSIGSLIALPLMDILGRRLLLFGGTALCIVGTILLTINYSISKENEALLLTGSIVFLIGFQIGPGSVFFVFASELFPNEGRSLFSSVLQFFNFMPNLLVVLLFTVFTDVAKWLPFATYLAGMLICGGILLPICPETKGKSREDIDRIMVQQNQQQDNNVNDINNKIELQAVALA